jgi:hypothetical protein
VDGATLVATVTGSDTAKAGSLSVTIKPDSVTPPLDAVLLGPLGLALLIILARMFTLGRKWSSEISVPDYDYSKSFATPLTAIGGLLAAFLATNLITDTSEGLSKTAYQGLGLTFAAVALLAPLVYVVSQDQVVSGTPPTVHYTGDLRAMFVAATLTLWAVVGQLITIFLLLQQLRGGNGLTLTAMVVIGVVVIFGIVATIAWAWNAIAAAASGAQTTKGDPGTPKAARPFI